MRAFLYLGIMSSLLSFSAFAKKVDCHQLDGTRLGGTYYEAEIIEKNTLANLKIIDVTGGISTVLSLNKGPFKGVLNSNARDPQWKSFMRYGNVTGGDCKYNQCVTLVLPADMLSQMGHFFGGYVAAKDDHASNSINLKCQVY